MALKTTVNVCCNACWYIVQWYLVLNGCQAGQVEDDRRCKWPLCYTLSVWIYYFVNERHIVISYVGSSDIVNRSVISPIVSSLRSSYHGVMSKGFLLQKLSKTYFFFFISLQLALPQSPLCLWIYNEIWQYLTFPCGSCPSIKFRIATFPQLPDFHSHTFL